MYSLLTQLCDYLFLLYPFDLILTGIIDIAAPWFSDLKNGVCKESFWLNKEQCCWDSEDNTNFEEEESCEQVRRRSDGLNP